MPTVAGSKALLLSLPPLLSVASSSPFAAVSGSSLRKFLARCRDDLESSSAFSRPRVTNDPILGSLVPPLVRRQDVDRPQRYV